jgi:predicted dehydrogenase
MKLLFVGLGSIGQRHLRNVKRLFGEDVELSAYRVRRLNHTFSDSMTIRDGVNLEEEFNIKVFTDYFEALQNSPDVVFITNITAKHIECAMEAVQAGCDIFMEKPLSDNFDRIQELENLVREKDCVFYMGFQNRFHPCIQYARTVLAQDMLGNLLGVSNEFGERLTTMHSYEDYRQTYMAKKDMGGGPILNLQIHCFDYLQWLIGIPISVCTIVPETFGIDIDVEGAASSLFSFQTHQGKIIPVYSHTDFFQFPPTHRLKIVGEKGYLDIDLNKAQCYLYVEGVLKEEVCFQQFVRNDMFIEELKDFFYCVQNRKQPDMNLQQGIISLRMALAAKESANNHNVVNMEDIV